MMELNEITNELERSSEQVSVSQLQELIDRVNNHKRIFVYGTGRSGLMLKAFAMRLMQMGYTSYVIGETTTPSTAPGDLLVVASASGETGSVNDAVISGLKQGMDVVAITGSQESTLSHACDPLIRIDVSTKFASTAASIQPLGSLFEQMLLLIFDSTILRMSRMASDMNSQMARRHASIE